MRVTPNVATDTHRMKGLPRLSRWGQLIGVVGRRGETAHADGVIDVAGSTLRNVEGELKSFFVKLIRAASRLSLIFLSSKPKQSF